MALARVEREARAVAALSHPNIRGIFGLERQDDLAFAVMELLEGESLRERLFRGALPVRKAIEHAVQIAQGLAAAHNRGIVTERPTACRRRSALKSLRRPSRGGSPRRPPRTPPCTGRADRVPGRRSKRAARELKKPPRHTAVRSGRNP